MREIKFRGRTLSGKWVYGLLAHDERGWFISNSAGKPFAYAVRPETIGQYTGLKDKNGVEIYEGDILLDLPRKLFTDSEQSRRYGKVYWKEKDACFGLLTFRINDRVANYDEPFPMSGIEKHEVIGNIWEHSHLLEANQ